jgi:hypothetical protein
MSGKYNTQHPDRGRSAYSVKGKAANADRYGKFTNGQRVTPDRLVKPTSSQVTLAA